MEPSGSVLGIHVEMRRLVIAAAVPVVTGLALAFGSQPVAAGGGCFQPDTQGTGNTVEIKERCFTPTVLYVQPGASVTWNNHDSYQHLVVGSLASWSGGAATLEGGQTVAREFPYPGIYAYSCPLHYGMNGAIVVGDGKQATALAVVQPAGVKPAAATIRVKNSGGAGPWPPIAGLAALVVGAIGYVLGRRRGVAVTKS